MKNWFVFDFRIEDLVYNSTFHRSFVLARIYHSKYLNEEQPFNLY